MRAARSALAMPDRPACPPYRLYLLNVLVCAYLARSSANITVQESTPLQSPVMRHNLAMDQQQRSHHQHEWAKRYTPGSFVMPRPSEYAQEKHALQSPLSPPSSMYHQHRSPGLPFSPSSHAHHGSYHLPSSSNVAIIDRYVCDECQKSFSRPSSLRIHQHSHTGERPFVCTVQGCQRAFSVRSNMRRHMKVHNV